MMYNGFYNGWGNGYQPYMTQPVQQTQAPAQQIPQPSQDIFVPSAAAAEAYLMAPNSAVRLWDSNMKTFYIRRTDQSGRSFPMETYDFHRREAAAEQPQQNSVDYGDIIKKLIKRFFKG